MVEYIGSEEAGIVNIERKIWWHKQGKRAAASGSWKREVGGVSCGSGVGVGVGVEVGVGG